MLSSDGIVVYKAAPWWRIDFRFDLRIFLVRKFLVFLCLGIIVLEIVMVESWKYWKAFNLLTGENQVESQLELPVRTGVLYVPHEYKKMQNIQKVSFLGQQRQIRSGMWKFQGMYHELHSSVCSYNQTWTNILWSSR